LTFWPRGHGDGANTGIGQGIAVALAQAGADVALVGRTPRRKRPRMA
jgi:NAD(P)-dependent dehydrogenase (short-subunit alcohol dehydrogenase family)